MLESGASGYLTKDEVPEVLIEALRGVARGEDGWISKRVEKIIGKQSS
jgi:DNA-binding NarL/FixJ family response regulator